MSKHQKNKLTKGENRAANAPVTAFSCKPGTQCRAIKQNASCLEFLRSRGLDGAIYEHLRCHLSFRVSEAPVLVIRPGKPKRTSLTVRVHGDAGGERHARVGEYSNDCMFGFWGALQFFKAAPSQGGLTGAASTSGR